MKRFTTTGGKCFEVRTTLRAEGWIAFIDRVTSEANPPRRVRRVRKIKGIFTSSESAIESAIEYANAHDLEQLGCAACQLALEQIEMTGSSVNFVQYETTESSDGLVYSYECEKPNCRAQWIREVQTEFPDNELWVLAGKSHSV